MKHGQKLFIFSFLVVPVTVYVIFVAVPYVTSMLVAFTKWRGLSMNITFNGINNFTKLFNDPNFWNALSHNGIALVVLLPVIISIALFFAFLFTQGIRGGGFFRITFFFPQVMSAIIVGVLWSFVYHPTIGLLNGALGILGIQSMQSFPWLGDPDSVFGSILAVTVWQAVGFYMVLFITGMESIPAHFYEAARIDGANSFVLFTRITIPMLWEAIRTAIVFLALGAMDMYAIVMIMTNGSGGPSRAADVVPRYLTESAFQNGEWGYATAMAVVLMFIILGISILSLRFTRREVLEF
ncbi:MAG: sugar ABC transporter permease [Chloroflexi bacterium]|nr:sugar ABC transporter permease [Chloroflexota bacterium]